MRVIYPNRHGTACLVLNKRSNKLFSVGLGEVCRCELCLISKSRTFRCVCFCKVSLVDAKIISLSENSEEDLYNRNCLIL